MPDLVLDADVLEENQDIIEETDDNITSQKDDIAEDVADTDTSSVESFDEEEAEPITATGNYHEFTKLSDKYDDMMSSASAMILFGVVGYILVALILNGIIFKNTQFSSIYLTVICIIFGVLLIGGIVTYINAKNLKVDAQEQDKMISEIKKWASDCLDTEAIDANSSLTDSEEVNYFNRKDTIKAVLMHEFEDADEELIEELSEDIYDSLYEQKGE